MISNAMKNTTIIGVAFLAISNKGKPVKLLATNKLVPIGGVTKPIASATVMRIPKCIGSMPNSLTSGKKIGVKMIVNMI